MRARKYADMNEDLDQIKQASPSGESECAIWGETLPLSILDPADAEYLLSYVGSEPPDVQVIWSEMDRVWDELGLDNSIPIANQPVHQFYSHPVWMLNALFTAADHASRAHRQAIAAFIAQSGARKIADFGGGGAELSRQIILHCPDACVDIVEPFPSALGRYRISQMENVQFVSSLKGSYDLIIAQDVLEHVDKPLAIAADIFSALRPGGIAIFANCFFPVIKCHLPRTFHLRATFKYLANLGGLEYRGLVQGAEHAQIFARVGANATFPSYVYIAEQVSRTAWPLLRLIAGILHVFKERNRRS